MRTYRRPVALLAGLAAGVVLILPFTFAPIVSRGAPSAQSPQAPCASAFVPYVAKTARASMVPWPAGLTTASTAEQEPGIFGRVTCNNAAAAGIALTLNRYGTDRETVVATTTTAADGRYLFANVPTLPVSQTYSVRFGPNSADDRMVALWLGPDIAHYVAGMSQPGGSFDIGNIALIDPPSGAVVTLPVTFTWSTRPVSDSYVLQIFDPRPQSANVWSTGNLGHVGQARIDRLVPEPVQDQPYGWGLIAVQEWSANGTAKSYGFSFYYHEIAFRASGPTEVPLNAIGPPERPAFGKGRLSRLALQKR